MRPNAREIDSAPSAASSYRRLKFIDRTVQALKPIDRRVQYWDESLPGFGLRISPAGRKSPKGRKTWIVMYRRPNGSAVRLKLGTYPAVSLADARLKAKSYFGQIEIEGRDPVAERQADRDAETFGQLAEIYMRKWAKQAGSDGRPRKRSWREDERQINLHLLPAWRTQRVKDITRRDVRDLIERIAERRLRKGNPQDGQEKVGAPIMSNRVLALVKKMFNFALDREWMDANPAARLKPVSPESARDRVLSAEEIRVFWRELDSEHHRIATLFRTLLDNPAATSWNPGSPSLNGPGSGSSAARSSQLARIAWRVWNRGCGRSRGNRKLPLLGFRLFGLTAFTPSFGFP